MSATGVTGAVLLVAALVLLGPPRALTRRRPRRPVRPYVATPGAPADTSRRTVGPVGPLGRAGRVGGAVAAVVLLVVVGPVGVAAVAAAVAMARWWRVRRAAHRHRTSVRDELPDVTDLLALAVDAGLTPHLAIEAVVRHGTGSVTEALAAALDRVGRGARLADALEVLRDLGPALHPLVDALVAAERYGTPLARPLARIADDGRADRRRRLEEEARKVPVRLLFPLVCCILPSVGLLTVVPVAGAALEGLQLPSP